MGEHLACNLEQMDDRLRVKLLTAGLETSSNFVMILNEQRLVWWVNRSFTALTGLARQAVAGRDVRSFFSDNNNPDVLAAVQRSLEQKQEWRGEIISRRSDGRDRVVGVAVTPVFDERSGATYFLIVGRDITDKVRARDAIAAAKAAQDKAEKLFALGTLAAGIAHEINQPLNAIRVLSGGMLYLLAQGESLQAEEFAESLKEIAGQTERIAEITKHLRSFVHKDELRQTPCDLSAAVAMALKLVGKQLADHGVSVQTQLQPDLPPVLAVSTGLQEIVINLLVNAMQALDSVERAEKKIIVRTYFAERVMLEVIDNGPGVDPALGNKIFESFVSTKTGEDNMGLGLAIVSTIVAASLGTIEVRKNELAGATFVISLPGVVGRCKEGWK